MSRIVRLNISPETAADQSLVLKLAGSAAGIPPSGISQLRIIRKSVDARRRNIVVNLEIEVFASDDPPAPAIQPYLPKNVTGRREVIVVGAGPAGLFAALRLIELGIRPVILERGKDVASPQTDIAILTRDHQGYPPTNNYWE